jgi:DnaJ like chaperone protein
MKAATWIGGLFGFMWGGPLGAVTGAVLGSLLGGNGASRELRGNRSFVQNYGAIFAIAGKLAKADGKVSDVEIDLVDTFIRESLSFNDEQRQFSIEVFSKACYDEIPADDYIKQFGHMARGNRQLQEGVLSFLVALSLCDGELHPDEVSILESAVRMWGLDSAILDRLLDQFGWKDGGTSNSLEKSYAVLEIDSSASDSELKTAYRKKSVEFHPDKVQARGVPEDILKFSSEKFTEIQGAYEMIKRSRGL